MTSGYGTTYGNIAVDPRASEGTLSRRFWAYLIDIVVIAALTMLLYLLVGILGVLTFGIGWLLFAVIPFTAIVYNAITISGPSQGTIGMRLMGMRVLDATAGGRVSLLAAAVHALLFYVFVSSAGLLLAIDILFGLMRADSRMGRDLVTNVVFVRSPP
jgi:uncharacterized RDD family membrane protein YckC